MHVDQAAGKSFEQFLGNIAGNSSRSLYDFEYETIQKYLSLFFRDFQGQKTKETFRENYKKDKELLDVAEPLIDTFFGMLSFYFLFCSTCRA